MKNKTMKAIGLVLLCVLLLCGALLSGCAKKEEAAPREPLENVVSEKDGKYSCSFDGVRHGFIVDKPDRTEGAPLVLMLHGYGESAEAFRNNVHFEEYAVPLSYFVVYVTGAPDPNDATSAAGWNSGISADGNRDVDFLAALAIYLTEEYSLDKERVFAVGYSNGAFMAHRLAMDAGDVFAAAVSVSGKMPASVWDRRNETNETGFFQITGEKDDVVPKNSDGSVKYAKDPAIEDVMDYWASSGGLELTGTAQIGNGSVLKKYTKDGGKKQVWDLFVKNGRHSWPSEQFSGFDTNSLIMEFLEAQQP